MTLDNNIVRVYYEVYTTLEQTHTCNCTCTHEMWTPADRKHCLCSTFCVDLFLRILKMVLSCLSFVLKTTCPVFNIWVSFILTQTLPTVHIAIASAISVSFERNVWMHTELNAAFLAPPTLSCLPVSECAFSCHHVCFYSLKTGHHRRLSKCR